MPTEADHIKVAVKNQRLINHLWSSDEFSAWTATVAFYKAVHLVEAMYARLHGRDHQCHKERNYDLKRGYPSVWKHYRIIFSASLVARYLELDEPAGVVTKYSSFEDYLNPDEVRKSILIGELAPMESMIRRYLTQNLVKDLSSAEFVPPPIVITPAVSPEASKTSATS